jgi:glycosyltransferase involved in cell wall biosynthesis
MKAGGKHAMHPDVDILVVPREQFSKTAQSLESIYAKTQMPFSLTYVDGNSPPRVRRYLEWQAEALGFTLIRRDHFLWANQARNIGLAACHGKYVVFIDNDVVVVRGWLERLVACAEETGAGVVGPLYYTGDPQKKRIHTAGAELSIKHEGGTRTFYERHRFVNEHADSVKSVLHRRPIDLVEFHCLLARRDVVDRVGLDEQLFSFFDHNDFCIGAKHVGATIYSEPEAVVSHLTPPPLALSDLPFYLLRWSNAWIDPSLKHFARKHGLQPDDEGLQGHYRYRDAYRRKLLQYVRGGVRRLFGAPACATLDGIADRYVFNALTRLLCR